MSPGKGGRGIPCRESAPPFLQGFSVHPVRTLKRATGRFRPTAESLKAAYRTSPQLCQERTFAIRKENLGICAGALGVGRQDVNGRYRTGSFLSFFPRMFWNDQRGAHGRSVYRFFLALGVPLVFGACIGAAFRGRFGRGLGLVTLALGLAGLLYGALTFTTYRDGYGLFAWVLQILMAGGVFCFGGACWLAARRKRQGVEKTPWDWRQR